MKDVRKKINIDPSCYRLTYYNLKSDTGLNVLSPKEKQKIWVPGLIFTNTENNLR